MRLEIEPAIINVGRCRVGSRVEGYLLVRGEYDKIHIEPVKCLAGEYRVATSESTWLVIDETQSVSVADIGKFIPFVLIPQSTGYFQIVVVASKSSKCYCGCVFTCSPVSANDIPERCVAIVETPFLPKYGVDVGEFVRFASHLDARVHFLRDLSNLATVVPDVVLLHGGVLAEIGMNADTVLLRKLLSVIEAGNTSVVVLAGALIQETILGVIPA